jgi:hypothetical protein
MPGQQLHSGIPLPRMFSILSNNCQNSYCDVYHTHAVFDSSPRGDEGWMRPTSSAANQPQHNGGHHLQHLDSDYAPNDWC